MRTNRSVGFIGGGRVARIMLGGWSRAGALPERVVVSDASAEVAEGLQRRFASIRVAPGDNREPASQDLVFLALHPPAIAAVLAEVAPLVNPRALVVSLAPKITLEMIGGRLGAVRNLARVIPNAPSIVNAGFNPMAFAETTSAAARRELESILRPLGECPEVPEAHLEAYAILTAMGPTYFWFQFGELLSLSQGFGLDATVARRGLTSMIGGALATMTDSQFASLGEVEDLIPVKPLVEHEESIRAAYRAGLEAVHARIAPQKQPVS